MAQPARSRSGLGEVSLSVYVVLGDPVCTDVTEMPHSVFLNLLIELLRFLSDRPARGQDTDAPEGGKPWTETTL